MVKNLLVRDGVARPDDAAVVAEGAVKMGLSATQIAEVLRGRRYTANEAMAAPGPEGPELVELANTIVRAEPELARFLSDTALDNHPEVVRWLAALALHLEELEE